MNIWTISPEDSCPLIIAHRGMAIKEPDNTPAAFAAALANGADGFETDIQVTSDNVVICFHDKVLLDDKNFARSPQSMSYAEIIEVRPRVVKIEDALSFSPHAAVLLDLKSYSQRETDAIVLSLADIPKTYNIVLGVWENEIARQLFERVPRFPQLSLAKTVQDFVEFQRLGGMWARLPEPRMTDMLPSIHELKLKVLVGIADDYPGNVGAVDTEKVARILACRPEGILIDDPRLCRRSVEAT